MKKVTKNVITISFAAIGITALVFIWSPIIYQKRYDIHLVKPKYEINECVSVVIKIKDIETKHIYKIRNRTKYLYLLRMEENNPMLETGYEKIEVVDRTYQKEPCIR